MQDIIVTISLETQATPQETLIPLIISLESEKAYGEYAGLDAFLADYPADTAAGKAAAAMYGGANAIGKALATVAAIGLDGEASGDALATALTGLRAEHDGWYFFVPVGASDSQLQALAEWAAATVLTTQQITAGETESEKLLVASISEPDTADITAAQTVLCYDPENQDMAAAWIGRMAGYYPQLATWKWKELSGLNPVSASATTLQDLLSRHINTYVHNHGRDYMREGVCADGEFIDTVISRWEIKQLLRKGLVDLFVDTPHVPYDDTGFAMVGGAVLSALRQAVEYGLILTLNGKPQFTVSIPVRADASPQQAAQRVMPDILWNATLTGGVHGVKVSGVLSINLTSEE